MELHVKVLAVLNLVVGGLTALLGLLTFLAMGTVAGLAGLTHDAASFAIIGITGTALGVFFLLLGLPAVAVGWGLLKLRPWARVLGIVVSILSLLYFPLGTAIGVYGLWVLLTRETERLFAVPPAAR
ncbi:MAG TPA: hypothetical protein VNI83_10580 [Vicinamibacterales bacterium]|jgi:hypothetical protein|nr:hypothetical protein [Vicinamibacterales bacterium]